MPHVRRLLKRVKTRVYLHRVCVQVDYGIARTGEYAHRRAALSVAEQIVVIVIRTLPHENRARGRKPTHARERVETSRLQRDAFSREGHEFHPEPPCCAYRLVVVQIGGLR